MANERARKTFLVLPAFDEAPNLRPLLDAVEALAAQICGVACIVALLLRLAEQAGASSRPCLIPAMTAKKEHPR